MFHLMALAKCTVMNYDCYTGTASVPQNERECGASAACWPVTACTSNWGPIQCLSEEMQRVVPRYFFLDILTAFPDGRKVRGYGAIVFLWAKDCCYLKPQRLCLLGKISTALLHGTATANHTNCTIQGKRKKKKFSSHRSILWQLKLPTGYTCT